MFFHENVFCRLPLEASLLVACGCYDTPVAPRLVGSAAATAAGIWRWDDAGMWGYGAEALGAVVSG